MTANIKQLGRLIGVAALGAGLLVSAGCEEAAKQCGLTCPEKGVAEGNASISGFAAIDGFFNSVVKFEQTAGSVNASLKGELDAIKAGFQLTDAEVEAAGSLGAAMKAKLEADFDASLKIKAQPARCDVDASVTAKATVDCQVEAGCEVKGPKASVECKGECTADASVMAECSAEATLECEVTGPSLECEGTCEGTCELSAAAACEGTCKGECSGECSVKNTDGSCNGSCDGECKGSCEVQAGASCSGKCTGSCKATPPSGKCEGSAKASCKANADASVQCEGTCDGEFEPPKADCDASASCEASAKADAKFNVQCTPPSIDIGWELGGSLDADAQANFDLAISSLKVHLPNLLASLKKGDLVIKAGAQLVSDGKAAIEGTVDALADGDVDAVAAYRIGACVPGELKVVGDVVGEAGGKLKGNVEAAVSIQTELIGG